MAASDDARIRVYTSLSSNNADSFLNSVYDKPENSTFLRYSRVIETYMSKHKRKPEYVARSPGRVNLIGEHIDYEGYSVLPMAIRQDTIVAIGQGSPDQVTVSNVQEGFDERSFSSDFTQEVDMGNHSWTNYVQAAYKGVFEYLQTHEPAKMPQTLVGLNLVIEGQVPQGSGLSSSAAIVCASALAVLGYYGVSVPKWRIAEFTAKCEKYVGTESGGMDQAISIMGEKGLAKLVHFKPHLHTEDVPLPQGVTFVVANSLTRSAKAEAAPRQYNMRVVECRLAAAVLGLHLGLSQAQAREVMTLSEVEPRVLERGKQYEGAKGSLQGAAAAVVSELLSKDKYTHTDLKELLGEGSLEKMFGCNASQMRSLHVAAETDSTSQPVGFKLRQRALHVYSEKERVPLFKQVCDSSASPEEKIQQLARLMNDSQDSCRDLYDCSCEELDHLIQLCRKHGAEASRLTGAGWGGCTVSLVREEKVVSFIRMLQEEYYAEYDRIPQEYFVPDAVMGRKPKAGWENIVFASRPSSGVMGVKPKAGWEDAVLKDRPSSGRIILGPSPRNAALAVAL